MDAIILKTYGAGTTTDALFTSLAIPLFICRIFEVQAPNVLVPVFASSFTNLNKKEREKALGNFIVCSSIVLFFVALIGMLIASLLIPLQVPGFNGDIQRVAVSLNRILFWLIFIQGIDTIFKCLLLSNHHFFIPSSYKVIYNLFVVVSILVLQKQIGIFAVAVGYIAGSLVSLMTMVLTTVYKGIGISLTFRPNDPHLRTTYRRFLYPLSGHFLSESKDLIENFLCSFLSSGYLSLLRYANRIVSSISGVLLGGFVTTTLPLASHYAAENKIKEMKTSIFQCAKLLCFGAFPLAVWLVLTSKWMLVLLFERGMFTRHDSVLLSMIIAVMSPYILFSRAISIFQTPFFAIGEMKKPLYSMIVSFGVYVAIALAFIKTAGVFCFPLAHSVSTLLATVVMVVIFVRHFGAIDWKEFNGFILRLSIATAAFGLLLALLLSGEQFFKIQTTVSKINIFTIPTVVGFVIFACITAVLKIADWSFITKRLALVRLRRNST
ncbi:MAG TPA: lipid II flippase MurJ [Chitinivibrionales bacterium]|nr:lipid II flippase MurJ [Chitinivibrionales bacterium]